MPDVRFASASPRLRTSAIVLGTALAALGLASCGAGAAEESSAPAPTTTAAIVEEAPTTAAAEATEAPPAAPEALPDICDLVSDDEVTGIIGVHVIATDFTYGSIQEGGQCIWTTDPSGDVFAPDAGQLELVAWVPGGIFAPPDDAPTAGTAGTATTDAGAYFTSDDRVFWLRLTGRAYLDSVAVSATQSFAATVDSRV